jgi:hypothetical protein
MRLAFCLVLAMVGLFSAPAAALNVHAIYSATCDRTLGVILRVDKREIHLLRFDGQVVQIPRHEIVSLLYYPVSQLPTSHIPTNPKFRPLRVKTLLNGKVVDLVEGWPVDYSDSKISFVLRDGKEIVISRDSIWSLEFNEAPASDTTSTPHPAATAMAFAHPQSSFFCEPEPTEQKTVRLFAQQLLNDQVVIKRELDRLQEGYEEILSYEKDQKFYPIPQLYHNRTSLGLWVSFQSRYGGTKGRPNNFTPLLIDELSTGPFGYQHIFLTGSAPQHFFIHNEAQSQIYYRFKAAYFHASAMLDPNLILVGNKYRWSQSDMEGRLDDRINDIFAIEFGFDLGPLALQVFPAVVTQSALQIGDRFFQMGEGNLWRAGPRLTFRKWQMELLAGFASTNPLEIDGATVDDTGATSPGPAQADWRYGRLNIAYAVTEKLTASLNSIYRRLDWSGTLARHNFDGSGTETPMSYASTTVSTALQGTYQIGHRFAVGGNLILERVKRNGTGEATATDYYPKVGLFTSFAF